jgi:type II secretion system protein L
MSLVRVAFVDDDGGWRETSITSAAASRKALTALIVPGARVMGRMINVAGSTTLQMNAAALGLLADELAQPAQSCIAAVGSLVEGRRLACVASRTDIERWRAIAKQQGMTPDVIVPDFALLPLPGAGSATTASHDGEIVARTNDLAFACQPELAALLLGGCSIDDRNFEEEVIRSVRSGALASAPDFARAMPERTGSNQPPVAVGRIVAAASVALVLGAAAPWVHAMRLDGAARDVREAAETVARTALPGADRIVNARAQLEEALLPVRSGQALVNAAAAIVEGASTAPGVSISRLEADVANAVSATLSVPRLEDLEPVRLRLAEHGLTAIETPGPATGGMIAVDITVRVQP